MSTITAPTEVRFKRVLGLPSHVFFGLAYRLRLHVRVERVRPAARVHGRLGAAARLHAVALVTGLNILGIKLLAGLNLAFVGAQFVFVAVFAVMAIGDIPDFGRFADHQDVASADVMTAIGGDFLNSFFTAAYVPVVANVIVGLFGLTALFISLSTVASMISFGALAAFSFVNLSVIKTYVVDKGRRGGADLVKYAVIPFLGFAFTIYLWTKLSGVAFEVGLAWLAAGFLYLVYLTRGFRKPPRAMYTGD